LKELLEKLAKGEITTDEVLKAIDEAEKEKVPRSRLNDKIEEVKELQGQLKDRDKQLSELSKKAKDSEELQATITQLQETNKKTAQEYESKIQQQTFDYALEKALTGAQARNPKAVKALLNTEYIKLDGDKLLGLDEQLNGLKESDAYLFGEAPSLRGRQPNNSGSQQQQLPQIAQFQKDYDNAINSGDTALAISLKNKMFTMNKEE
jgi:DNA repair exonuclease SbcCD ATPase subunit